jgi:DNA-binding transcriptional LysR family regulator
MRDTLREPSQRAKTAERHPEMRMAFDFSDLRLFVAVAHAGSITRGAQRVHMALAAASARIRKMETRLDAPLLIRGARGIRLSPAGEALLRHAEALLKQSRALHEELAQHGRTRSATIRLLCNTAAITELLPRELEAFLKPRPDVNIEIEELPSARIVESIASGAADLGIVADSAELGALERVSLTPDRLVVVTSADHALARSRSVRFEDTLERAFVTLPERSALRQHLAANAARIGARVKSRLQMPTFGAAARMVERDVGIAIMPATAAARCQKSMRIRRVALAEPWADRMLTLCARDFSDLPEPTRQLASALERSARGIDANSPNR